MNKRAYYEESLAALKKELRQESHTINALNDILGKLRNTRYQPLDSLEGVIADLESRRGTIKEAITKLESLL